MALFRRLTNYRSRKHSSHQSFRTKHSVSTKGRCSNTQRDSDLLCKCQQLSTVYSRERKIRCAFVVSSFLHHLTSLSSRPSQSHHHFTIDPSPTPSGWLVKLGSITLAGMRGVKNSKGCNGSRNGTHCARRQRVMDERHRRQFVS